MTERPNLMPFEILYCPLMHLGRMANCESAKVATLAGLWIFPARIEGGTDTNDRGFLSN
jgi:hypothetical protein